MILKLGRVVDGKVVETFFIRSEQWAMAFLFKPEELNLIVAARNAPDVDRIVALAPNVPGGLEQMRVFRVTDWKEYLASIPSQDNPYIYDDITNTARLVGPGGRPL